jgi:Spy/CpxP family protein refolding chaperone
MNGDKSMNRKTWTIGAICAALLPLAALAQGDAPNGFGHFRGHGGDAALLAGVTLTTDQQTQISQIHQTARAQVKPVMQQLHTIQGQIRDALLASGDVNTSQLTALQAQASQLRSQLDEQRLNTELQVRAVLTPAQLATAASTGAQLKALHQQMHSLMGGASTASTPAQ